MKTFIQYLGEYGPYEPKSLAHEPDSLKNKPLSSKDKLKKGLKKPTDK